jgi:Sensors of blue-light using FAD
MTELRMTVCQLLYVSRRAPAVPLSIAHLLAVSRKKNAEAGLTGFLFFDGERFAQVLEGPDAGVRDTYARITRDARHRDIVLMSCEAIAARQFGYWSMGLQEGMDDETRLYLLEALTLSERDLAALRSKDLLQFLLRLANITRKLDEMNAMLAQKC